MYHRFSVEVAAALKSVPCALVLGHIDYLVEKARAGGEKRRNGKYWVNKSVKKIAELYPYYTEKQVRIAIDRLRKEGLVITAHFPTSECPSTLWYTLTKKGKTLLQKGGTDLPEPAKRFDQEGKTICPTGQIETPQPAKRFDQEGETSTKELIGPLIDPLIDKEEEDARARGDDPAWMAFAQTYERNIGLLPTSETERGDMLMFFEEFGAEALCEFIRYTARKHPDNPHVYFSRLCRNWLGKGITTAEQVRAAFLDYDRRKDNGRRREAGEQVYAAPEDVFG